MSRVIRADDPDLGNQIVAYQSREVVHAIGPVSDVEINGTYYSPQEPVYAIARNALDNAETTLEVWPAHDFQLAFATPNVQEPMTLARYGLMPGAYSDRVGRYQYIRAR